MSMPCHTVDSTTTRVKMWNSNEILFPKKRLGHLPGIDVGYQFYSRAEMVAVGLHSHWLYGIDYMGKYYSKMAEFKGYKFPLAVSIVCSGQSRFPKAKFLKACGTLPQTPAEIRKAEKSKVSQARNGDTESPIHSWFPNTALEKTLEKEPDQLQSPVNLFKKWDNGSEPSSISSSSCKTGKSTSSGFTSSSGGSVKQVADAKSLNSSASHTPTVPTTQYKNKSVHFEDRSVAFSFSSRSSSPKTANERSNPSKTPFSQNTSKPSPYPTPLKLTDDMQTPGTVFPSYVYDNESGKNKKIRYQYVYSGLNPEKLSQFKAPIEEEFGPDDCLEQTDKETPHSKVNLEDSSTEKESNVCPTLSSWLQLKPEDEGCIDQSPVAISEGILDFGKTPGDRPILGTVAAHWNADETPKLWGGNGIPNTTTKYKEDQKVSWHATPFEQRLEKALLEDQSIPKRKQLGETSPIDL